MMWLARTVAAFIERYPTLKILALAFLILIGSALVASGLHFEIPKGYLYFAMGFAVAVKSPISACAGTSMRAARARGR